MAPATSSDAELRGERLKERIYLTFTALAVVLVLRGHEHLTAPDALFTLGVSLLGTLTAVFTAAVIAHLVVHGQPMNRAQLRRTVTTSFGTLGAVSSSIIFLALSAAGVWELDKALRAATITLIATLIAIAYVAVRRSTLTPLQRILALGAEGALGVAVVGIQTLAHG